MVRRRQAQRQLQLPGSPSARPAAEQGGHHLGRGAGRYAACCAIRICTAKSASSPTSSKGQGIKPGDRVTIYMPMVPELAIAVLACARIGAVHSVVFGGFSADAVADRNNDAKAKLIITADGGWRRGKVVPLKQSVDAALEKSPTVDEVHRLQSLQSADRHEAGPRLLVARTDGRRLRRLSRRAVRQRTSSVHPLHQRLDRQTEGRAAHHGRVSARRVADAQMGLRSEGGRHLLVHRRHRLGDGPQLHPLRPAGQRRHHGDVRRGPESSARGSLLVDHRKVPRQHLLHRPDRDPGLPQVGRCLAGQARSVEPAAARHRGRADQSRSVDVVSRSDRPRNAAPSSIPGGRPRPA